MAKNHTLYFCDIATKRWWTLPATKWPVGWWDEKHLILRTTNGFDLLDIDNNEKQPLLPRAAIASFSQKHGIHESQLSMLASYWNGRQFEFYFSSDVQSVGEPSCFVRLRRPDATLDLVSATFEFEKFGRFDTSGMRYVYATRVVGDCCDGVSIRDLRAKSERALVPATTASADSFPFFYGDSICYLRSNELWRIDVTGSNNARLFPPPQ